MLRSKDGRRTSLIKNVFETHIMIMKQLILNHLIMRIFNN